MLLHFKQFYRGFNINLIFRENEGAPLEGGDSQLFHRAHFAGFRGGFWPDISHQQAHGEYRILFINAGIGGLFLAVYPGKI